MKLKKRKVSNCPRELKDAQADLLKLILDDGRYHERSVTRTRASQIINTGGRSTQFCITQYSHKYFQTTSEYLERIFSASLGFLAKKSRVRLLKEYCASPPPIRHYFEHVLQFPDYVLKSDFGVVNPREKQILHSLLRLDLAVNELSEGRFQSASRKYRTLRFDSPILNLWLNLRSGKPRKKLSPQGKSETLKVWISADRNILFERTS